MRKLVERNQLFIKQRLRFGKSLNIVFIDETGDDQALSYALLTQAYLVARGDCPKVKSFRAMGEGQKDSPWRCSKSCEECNPGGKADEAIWKAVANLMRRHS